MKINISKLGTKLSKIAGRPGLLIKKHSPEICLGVGIVAIIGGTILACKATLEMDEVLDTAKDDIAEAKETGEKKDLALAYAKTSLNVAKVYSPAVGSLALGVGSILCGHNIMQKRQVAILAAYETLDKAFGYYRENVVKELGEEKDKQFRYSTKSKKITEEIVDPETGAISKVKTQANLLTCDLDDEYKDFSQYARIFDDSCSQWDKNPEYNLTFLKCQQNYMNDLLVSRGHVFLNEVYDALGFPRTTAGQVVGWVLDNENGDGYIDFGIYDLKYKPSREFVNGYNNAIILDFNVDGVVYDQI